MLQTVRAEKVDGVICQVSMLPSWVMVVKLFKTSAFSASSYYSLSENDIV